MDENCLLGCLDPLVHQRVCLSKQQEIGAKHFDEGKVELQYILAMRGLDDVAKVGTFGANKYGQWNYMSGAEFMRFLGSCARHLAEFIRGKDLDKESGLPHLAHLIYDALMILEWHYSRKGKDDRYRPD